MRRVGARERRLLARVLCSKAVADARRRAGHSDGDGLPAGLRRAPASALVTRVDGVTAPPENDAGPKFRPTYRTAEATRSDDIRAGALNFVLLGELFPPAVKARLVSLEMLPAAFFKFLATYGTSRAIDKGDLVLLFAFQSTVAAMGALVAWIAMPETRGRTPRQIRSALIGRPGDAGSPVPSRAASITGSPRRSGSPRPRPLARPSSVGMV